MLLQPTDRFEVTESYSVEGPPYLYTVHLSASLQT